MTWTVVWILLATLAVDFALRRLAARMILPIFERKPPFGGAPHFPMHEAQQVTFPTTNGITLSGRIYRQNQNPPRGVIVFCPEMEGDSTSAIYYCQGLIDAGFDVFSFDFRNQGESDCLAGYEPLHWLTDFEVDDTLAAVHFARKQEEWSELPLGIVGISRGGGAALAAACRDRSISRVAVEGAFSTQRLMEHYTLRWAALYIPQWSMNLFPLWHVRGTLALVRTFSQVRRKCRYVLLERELSRLRATPILQIHGGRDSYVPKETVNFVCKSGSADYTFWLVRKANHNKAREIEPEEYDRRLVEFFEPMCAVEHSATDTSAEPQPLETSAH